MASAIAALEEIFKNTIKIEMIILAVILYAAMIMVTLVSLIPIGIIVFITIILASTSQILLIPIILFLIIFTFLFMLFMMAIGSLSNAIMIKGARSSLEGKKFEIMQLFNEVKTKWLSLLGFQIIMAAVFGILFIILLIPAILVGLSYIENPPFSWTELLPLGSAIEQKNFAPIIAFIIQKFSDIILLAGGGFMLFSVISFLTSPFTVLIVPSIVFENKPVFGAIKNAISIGKKNYFFNIKILFVYILLSLIVSLFSMTLLFFVQTGTDAFSIVVGMFFELLLAVIAAKIYLVNKQPSG